MVVNGKKTRNIEPEHQRWKRRTTRHGHGEHKTIDGINQTPTSASTSTSTSSETDTEAVAETTLPTALPEPARRCCSPPLLLLPLPWHPTAPPTEHPTARATQPRSRLVLVRRTPNWPIVLSFFSASWFCQSFSASTYQITKILGTRSSRLRSPALACSSFCF
ncbi:hypothetical protein CMUS01_01015 [Colletotrichum musicola]|uniref:Uncharacterized protein n=1 Tax=Colletotrichum musicola TaxID=2175873 RepID=A0A8H6NXW3_9PEZI|nr:hypothetical protein CMUS01_01015 [Colletotrichum musicola]